MSKISIVIPFKNDKSNLEKIVHGISQQTRLPDLVIFVLDRISIDLSNEIIEFIKQSKIANITNVHIENTIPKYIGNTPNKGDDLFLAGHMRNIGTNISLSSGIDNIIFIDGDCIPQKTLVDSHLKVLSKDIPVLTVGRRRELAHKWMDRREVDAHLSSLNLFRKGGVVINNPSLLEQCLIVWSCNIGLNKRAIELLQKFNLRYYRREELFSSEFNGRWGGEDSFLGIQAIYCKVFITTLGDIASGVEHIDHPRPVDKYSVDHRTHFKDNCERLRKKVTINPLTIDFFG